MTGFICGTLFRYTQVAKDTENPDTGSRPAFELILVDKSIYIYFDCRI